MNLLLELAMLSLAIQGDRAEGETAGRVLAARTLRAALVVEKGLGDAEP